MNFDFEKKSLFIGIAAGFSVAILVLSLAFLVFKNAELANNNKQLQEKLEMQKIADIPVKKAHIENVNAVEANFDSHPTEKAEEHSSEFQYEEFPKHDVVKVAKEVSPEVKKQAREAAEKENLENAPLYVKHAQKFTADPNKKLIAIVIDDLGVHRVNSLYSAEKLPKEITFSYLPYGNSTQAILKTEQAKGREAMLHLPAEAMSPIDPGPDALYANMTREQIEKTTYKNLNQVIDYVVGANNHMGSKFTSSLESMKPVLEIMDKEKLFFMDSFTSAKTQVSAAKKAVTPDLPLLTRHIFLDHKRTNEFITGQLKKLERVADQKGYAIAIGHPHKVTTEALLKWIENLDTSKYQLVPITAIIRTELKK